MTFLKSPYILALLELILVEVLKGLRHSVREARAKILQEQEDDWSNEFNS